MGETRRYSKKREAIFSTLASTHEHPSAEWIYQQLKPDFPDLSLATVYRNLKEMVDMGDAVCVGNADRKDRFDAITHPHAHMLCRKCGKVIDIEIAQELADLCKGIEDDYAVEIDSYGVHFSGICKDCMAKSDTTEK